MANKAVVRKPRLSVGDAVVVKQYPTAVRRILGFGDAADEVLLDSEVAGFRWWNKRDVRRISGKR